MSKRARNNESELNKLANIISDLQGLTKRSLEVGIISHAGDPVRSAKGLYKGGRLTVGELAFIHEFGLGSAPVRSLIQEPLESLDAYDIVQTEMSKEYFWEALGTGVKNERKALSVIGKKLVNYLIKWFATCGEGSWDDLTEEYARRKAKAGYSEDPLHTTLQLMESLEYRIK